MYSSRFLGELPDFELLAAGNTIRSAADFRPDLPESGSLHRFRRGFGRPVLLSIRSPRRRRWPGKPETTRAVTRFARSSGAADPNCKEDSRNRANGYQRANLAIFEVTAGNAEQNENNC